MKFTAHSIELPDGSRTIPDWAPLASGPYCAGVLRTLRLLCPPSPDHRPRVADLGCLEGGFALEFARAGYDVVGVEARPSNFEKCQVVAKAFGLPHLQFVCDDARNIARYGTFDAIFCAGLLYHLDTPVAFLHMLGNVTRRALVLETHYAIEGEYTLHQLSPLTVNEGKRGRWYKEWDPKASPAEVESLAWASVGNSSSFWLEKKQLLQALLEAGFPIVYEQYDSLGNVVENDYIEKHCRSLFVAAKH